ncbi:MAG: GvpL/GvpF family gas vesicle protein [Bacillota bacterium]
MEGLYAYCVLGNIYDNKRILLNEGIDPKFPVYVINYAAFGAAVSKVSLAEFGEDALHENIQNNLKWVENKARSHSFIIEVLSDNHDVIPFRFCTIYNNEHNILKMLQNQYSQFCELLEKINNKSEWTLKVICNIEKFNAKIVQEKSLELDRQLLSKSRGAAYLLKKKFDALIKEEVENCLTSSVNSIYNSVAVKFGEDIVVDNNPVHETADKNIRCLQKWSLLINKNHKDSFLGKIQEINRTISQEGLYIDLTGPWPPYSFTVLNNKEEK